MNNSNHVFLHLLLVCRIEAAQCPDVVVAQIDPKKLKRKQSVNISVSVIIRQGIFFFFFLPRKLKDGGSPYSVGKYRTG